MALTAAEQELFDFAVAALPKWFTSDERHREELRGFAKIFGSALETIRYWFAQTLIGTADGPFPGLPDWLNQHAVDRRTRRQASEANAALRSRLKNPEDAITRPALLTAVNAILATEGISGTAAMLELPRDAAHLGDYTAMTGTGGAFTKSGDVVTFTPTVLPWPTPPWQAASVAPERRHQIVLATAEDAGNNGTFTITGLNGNGAQYTNAGGVVNAVDTTVTWTVNRLDGSNNKTDTFSRAYLGRGYRIAPRSPKTIIVILPFGSTEGTASSVREILRQKKGAGVRAIVERRLIA